MKRFIAAVSSLAFICVAMAGCQDQDKSTMKTETKITTPNGETTTTTEKSVKQTGENPPPPGR